MSVNDKIMFSIIVPIYNGAKTVASTLNDLLSIPYDKYEIIIVDDGSTDNTKQILSDYVDHKIRVLHHKTNRGVSAARNLGLAKAKGDYIIFVDSDDSLTKESLSILDETIRNAELPDYVRFSGIKINSVGARERIKGLNPRADILKQIIDPKIGFRCYAPFLAIKNTGHVVKFRENLKYMEDTMFYIDNLANDNARIVNIDDVLYIYNYNPNSKTKNIKNIQVNIDDLIEASVEINENSRIKNIRQKRSVFSGTVNMVFWTIRELNHITNKKEVASITTSSLQKLDALGLRPPFFSKANLRLLFLRLSAHCYKSHQQ